MRQKFVQSQAVKKQSFFKGFSGYLLLFSLLVLCLLSVGRYFDNVDYLIIDIISHFPVQYAMISFVLLIFCIWKRIISLSFLAVILFIINIVTLLDFNGSAHASVPNGNTFRVYSANINRHVRDLTKLIKEIERVDAEIVLLIEVTPRHMKQLESIIQRYGYNIIDPKAEVSGIGVIFLSKFPVLRHNIISLSDYGNVIFEVELNVNQNPVLFYGVHLIRLRFLEGFQIRQKEFLRLAAKISDDLIPVIIAGDFNITPFSPIFRKFLEISGLRDSREGFGWQPTWPAFLPILWIPIDHVLVSPQVKVHNRTTGSFIWSDHFPVIAELSLN